MQVLIFQLLFLLLICHHHATGMLCTRQGAELTACNDLKFCVHHWRYNTALNFQPYMYMTLYGQLWQCNCDHSMPCKKICFVCAATVVLDFRQACSGEMLTYTCAVNQGFALDWIVEPFLNGSTHIYGSCWVVHPLKGVYTAEVSHFHNVITLTLWPCSQILPTP